MKLAVKVTPHAKKSALAGWEDHPDAGRVLKLKIAARPIDGQANKEIIAFLSRILGIPKSSVQLVRGESGRIKMVELPDEAAMLLEQLSQED